MLFYYLRRNDRVFSESCLRFTTTNNFFDQRLQGLYEIFFSTDKDFSIVGINHYDAKYILGYFIVCNIIWVGIDHVLFLIHVAKEKH